MKTPDLQLRQELLDTIYEKWDEASNNNDAAARAAFFTEDAVLVTALDRFMVGRPSRNTLKTCSNNIVTATLSAGPSIPLTL
jgi:ketosteroid isomerase-like protein